MITEVMNGKIWKNQVAPTPSPSQAYFAENILKSLPRTSLIGRGSGRLKMAGLSQAARATMIESAPVSSINLAISSLFLRHSCL